jgi:hypothetical protein
MSVEQVAARLDERFRLLTRGGRTAVPRQPTLQGAIDWSYELLVPTERELFDVLGVFAGDFDQATEPKSTLGGKRSVTVHVSPPGFVGVSTAPHCLGGSPHLRILRVNKVHGRTPSSGGLRRG